MNDVYKPFVVWRSLFEKEKKSFDLECLRILKPNGGQLLIYTWALEQKQRQVNDRVLGRIIILSIREFF